MQVTGWSLCQATGWMRQMNTPYADLSEEEKESDREVARKFLLGGGR